MTIIIPLNPFKAVQKAQSKEKTRYYLCGVFVEKQSLVATDGVLLLKYELENETGVTDGIILQIDPNEKAMKPKHNSENVYIYVDVEKQIVETFYHHEDGKRGSRVGVCSCVIIDDTFPNYQRIIPDNTLVESCDDFAFSSENITIFGAAAKIMGKKGCIRLKTGERNSSPATVHFSGIPELLGVVMPVRFSTH